MPNLGPTELIIVLVIVLVIFGAGKIADIGGALGKGVKDFRASVKEEASDAEEEETPSSETKAKAKGAQDESKEEESSEEA